MRKAIRLSVTVWVEGEAEPAENFERLAGKAVREIIAAGRDARPEVTVTVKRVEELTEDDEEDDDSDDGN